MVFAELKVQPTGGVPTAVTPGGNVTVTVGAVRATTSGLATRSQELAGVPGVRLAGPVRLTATSTTPAAGSLQAPAGSSAAWANACAMAGL